MIPVDSKLPDVKLIKFKENGDERGHLVVLEGETSVPFAIQRVFYIYGSDENVIRGRHANRRSEFVLINICGTSRVRVTDGLGYEETFVLDQPHIGIYLPKMVWKDMYGFSKDSILLCLASEHYDSKEYIRNFDDFLREVNV